MNKRSIQIVFPIILLLIGTLTVIGFNQDNTTESNNTLDITDNMNTLFNEIFKSNASSIVSVRSAATVKEHETGEGTGFFINNKGYVLTSYDNVKKSESAIITFSKQTVEMSVEKSNEDLGLAILKPLKNIEINNFLSLSGDSEAEIADVCIALTNSMKSVSLTGKPSMLTGEIAGFYKKEEDRQNLFETSLSFESSNIGAPLLNIDGKVIGLCSKYQKAGRWLTTAIPTSDLRKFVEG